MESVDVYPAIILLAALKQLREALQAFLGRQTLIFTKLFKNGFDGIFFIAEEIPCLEHF